MADVVNLRQARKRLARAEKEKAAEANRVAFGRTKAERGATRHESQRERTKLDGHRRETGEDEG